MTPEQALKKWQASPFYRSQVVLGIDIGIEGIGVYVRKGPETVFARTYLVALPEAAPLQGRRLKRAMRRSRASLRHRDLLFRSWCRDFGLPVVEGDAKARTDAWSLRLRAAQKGVSSPEALSVCLRHILGRRGFSYHRDNDDLLQPWGETTDYASVTRWLTNACFDRAFGDKLKVEIDEEWMRKDGELTEKGRKVTELIDDRVAYFESNPLLRHIEGHLKAPPHLRQKAWDTNFPRDLIEQHAMEIIQRNARFLGDRVAEAASRYLKILNYARSDGVEAAERRVKKCPYLAKLAPDTRIQQPKCAKGSDLRIRHLNLVEFLGQRPLIELTGERVLANTALYEAFRKHIEDDNAAITSKRTRPRIKTGLRKLIEETLGITLPKKKDSSANEWWLDQVGDLLSPRLSSLAGRANCSGEAAEILLNRALARGWDNLRLTETWADFFSWRRDLEKGYGLYPQVEFLLGRRSKKGKQATPGILRRVFAELAGELGQDKPDIVVTEVIRSVARNSEERLERERELKERRESMDKIYQKHGLEEGGSHLDRVRVDLYEQQNGLCPYTGESLGSPLNPGLQVDHVYPREMGGTSDRINLVLTTAKANKLKGKRTPWQARSDFPELVQSVKKMKWGQAKIDLFIRQELSVPDWGNLTRTSQLARELRDAIAYWLEIKGNPEAIRARIGTPSGLQTAQCRRSKQWRAKLPEVDGKKDRENPRHHLWDAAVISHIPPGEGLQPVVNGGIFYPVAPTKAGDLGWEALDLGPDLLAFEKETKDQCLVIKHRPRKPKGPRTEETIYGRREDGQLIVRKPLVTGMGLVDKNAAKWIAGSGIPPSLLPKRKLEAFLEQDKDAKPLVLANGTRVDGVRITAPKESPVALLPHRDKQRRIIGWKIMGSPYCRLEIWLAPKPDKKGNPVFQRRFIPSPRGLASLHRLAAEGIQPWWGKQDAEGESLRKAILGGPLLPFSKRFCTVQIGDLLRIPYDAKGKVITPIWSEKKRAFECKGVAHWVWSRVTSLRSDGVVATAFAEKPPSEHLKAFYPSSPAGVAAFSFLSSSEK